VQAQGPPKYAPIRHHTAAIRFSAERDVWLLAWHTTLVVL